MRKTVFLHIGAHKTGSTSVQAWALRNGEILSEKGILFPRAGRNKDGNHSEIAWAISKDARSQPSVLQEILDELRSTSHSKVFISGEEFEYLQSDTIADLKKAFREFEVKIILSLRPQHEIIRSQYCEWIKQFLTNDDFSVFWRFHAQFGEYDFTEVVRKWSVVFGGDNITLISQPDALLKPYGIISSMLEVLNLSSEEFEFPTNTNVSDPSEVIYLWRYLLLKLQTFTGNSFCVYGFGQFNERQTHRAELLNRYGKLMGATRQMYLQGGYCPTRFRGYSKQEFVEIQSRFAAINTDLFRVAGQQLWQTVSPSKDECEDIVPAVPLEAIRKADELFEAIVFRRE